MSAAVRVGVAGRLRAAGLTAIGLIHLVVGTLMTLLVIVLHTKDGDPVQFMPTAVRLVEGSVAYRDSSSEYPPLALVAITLPRLLGGSSPATYMTVFSVISFILFLATLAAVYWIALHHWSAESPIDAAAMFVGLGGAMFPLVVWRFDILPAFLTAAALAAYFARRSSWTGLTLGLGVMAKIYPFFLGPVFVAAALVERRWKDAVLIVLVAGITVALVVAGPVLVAGTNAFSYVLYQENRGVEVESIAGGIAAFANSFLNIPAKTGLGFGAWQIASPIFVRLTTPLNVFTALMVAFTILAGAISFVRDQRMFGAVQPRTLIKYLTATLLAIILANKVLSPQYLVWLLPFVALMPGRQSLLLLVIAVLTTFIYPLYFDQVVRLLPAGVVALNVRNLLLVVMFVWVAFPERSPRATRELERGYVRDPAH